MSKPDKNKHSWRSIHDLFMSKISKSGVHFLPSGRIKTTEKLDYREVIEQASRSMIRFKKPERLIRMIVRIIAEQVKVSHTAVLLYKKKKNAYVLIDSKGTEGKKIPIGYVKIASNNPLINIFKERKAFLLDERGALICENLDHLLGDTSRIKKDKALKQKIDGLKSQMGLLGANICIPAYFKRNLLGILILGNKLSEKKFEDEEIGFFVTLANDVAMVLTNAQLIEDLQEKIQEVAMLYEREHRLFMHTSVALAAAIDARDPYTHGHTERTTHYSLIIADELPYMHELSKYKNFKETLHIASLLHDIGKIGIPDNILNKKRELNETEFEQVKKHPEIGGKILHSIKELADVIEIIQTHQERFDGTGYPKGLKGDQIPLIARIISVADTFDAITTDRPYRRMKSLDDAMKEIKKHSGTQFDPFIVDAFYRAYKKGKIKELPPAKY